MEKLKWRITWGQLSVGTIEWGQLSDHVGTGTKNSIVPKTSHPIGASNPLTADESLEILDGCIKFADG